MLFEGAECTASLQVDMLDMMARVGLLSAPKLAPPQALDVQNEPTTSLILATLEQFFHLCVLSLSSAQCIYTRITDCVSFFVSLLQSIAATITRRSC